MPVVDVGDGTRLHYEKAGSGPAVIFSHGVLMDAGMWHRQVEAFSGRFTCVTWDERGHGDTVTSGARYDFWDSARDLVAVLDDAGLHDAVLVGHSQGGFLSLRAALLAPQRVRGLVLAPSHVQELDADTQAAFRGIKAAWQAEGPAPVRDTMLGLLVGDPQYYPALSESWDRLDRDAIGNVFDCLIGLDELGDKVMDIEAPAVVVHGAADAAMPVELGRDLHDRLGNAIDFEVVAGAGHTPSLTHPDEFAAILDRFLTDHGGR